MKLTEIQIDCHGVWRNLTLPLRAQGLSVIYGPNEAGKTTLREFIGGVLFGLSRNGEQTAGGGGERRPAAGSLLIEDESGSHRIHRAAAADSAADACIVADDAARPAADVLAGYLQGIDAQVFERIFAVGLRELMELNSLSGDDLARHVFGLSLGPTGARILEAARRVDERRARLIDPLQKEGELVRLFERHDQLTARLSELGHLHARHTEWSVRRDQLECEIADLRKRHAGIAEQLRGHEFLERAWGPWDRIRDCRRELETLPEIAEFPERGLERLERLENEIAAAAENRDRLLAEVRQLREERLHPAEDAAWRAHAPTVRGFVEQRDWLEGLNRRRHEAQLRAGEREREFAAACEPLGPGWSAPQIERADVSAAGQRRLSGTAESFLAAQRRRDAIRRQYRRIAEACRDLKESLAEGLHDLDGRSIDAALAEARARVAGLHQQATLKFKEAELLQRLAGIQEHRERIAPQLALPRWVYVVLGVFAFMGVILAGWGMVAGVATSGIAGAIYVMLGITCGGLAWGLKTQYEGEAQGRLAEINEASAAATAELAAIRESIGQ
ncbi:MAG: AAA family ATPase, partial [Deltaproteobacteria bacterium]